MLSEERHTSRSPTESAQSDSIRAGPNTRLTTRQSERSSITEESDRDIPEAPPMPSSFRASTKSTSSTSAASTPTGSTPKQTNNSVNASKVINAIAFQRPPARNTSNGQKTNGTRRTPNRTTTTAESKRSIIPGLLGRVSARDIEISEPTAIYGLRSPRGKSNKSIFEKIDLHGRGATYLGSGSFSQLEDCIQNCLSRNDCDLDLLNYSTKRSYSYKNLMRASILDDYGYDGILSPDCHISIPINDDCYISRHKRHAADLSLEEIRQVNDALAKYGIPVFSYPSHSYVRPRPVSDVLSVCQQLLSDPSLRSHGDAQHAVQHVWDNLHYHSPQTYMQGYATPAMQGVASHLFPSGNQPPYSPVQSAVSHLFGGSPQYPYNPNAGGPPPPQGPSNPGQSAISRLFGGSQPNSYNPGPSAPPPPAYDGPPQNLNNPGQSAISRLFGGPQPNSYNPGPAPPPPPPPPSYGGPPQGPSNAGQSVLSRLFSGNS